MSMKQPSPATPSLKKRRVNLRLVAWVAVPALLLAVAVQQVHKLQIKRNARSLLEQADRAESKGDLAKAEEYLKLFLGYQPRDPGALAEYALIRVKRARTVEDRIGTIQSLDMALRADPGRRDIRRRLVEVAMSVNSIPIAQLHLKALLGRDSPGKPTLQREVGLEDGELEYHLGQCAAGEGDFAAAALWYKDCVRDAPQNIDAYVRLGDVLRNRLSDAAGADRVMDAREIAGGMVAANRNSAQAYLERARYRKQYQIEGAERDVARALELAPRDADVLVSAAAFEIERGQFDVARRHLSTGLEHDARNWRLTDAMVWLERRTGQLDDAAKWLGRGIAAATEADGRSRLRWVLADVLVDQGKWADATSVTETLSQERVRPELVRYLRGRIAAGESRWLEASKELEAISPLLHAETSNLAYPADLLLGLCYEQLGNMDGRYAAYRRAVSLDPQGPRGQLGLAATLAAMGRLDEALGAYQGLIDREPLAGIAAARLLVLRNLRSPEQERKWQEVEQVLARTEQLRPQSPEVAILRAEVLVAQSKWDDARQLLTRARDRQPDEVALWISLVELADRRETGAAALAILNEAQHRFGDRVELRLARINHWAKQPGPDASQALADLGRNLTSFSASDRERLLRELAEAQLRIGDLVEAGRLMKELVGLRPYDLGLRFTQFDLALQAGDLPAMESSVDGLRTSESQFQGSDDSGGAFWRCARARMLIWSAARKGRGAAGRELLDQARLQLVEAGSRRPSWPLVPLAEAQIDELSGNPDGAIKSYLQAIELGLLAPDVIRRTVQLLYDRRRYAQAGELMRRLQEKGLPAGDRQLERLAAEVSLQENDRASALAQAKKAIPADSRDYRDRLWLGQILWAGGEPAQAESELRKAVELGGAAPDAWIALVQYLARTGKKEQARAAIEQARQRLAPESAPLVLAHCYEEVGDVERARANLKAALVAHPGDLAILRAAASFAMATGATTDAEADLRTIIGLKSKAPDDADWARRLLAVLLASSGKRRQSVEAFQLLGLAEEGETYLPRDDAAVEEIRSQAKVLALRDNRDARRAAIRGFEAIVDREAPSADDLYLLARLYESDGNWTKAKVQMRSLLATDGDNPLFLAHDALLLLRQGSVDGAQARLDTLERREPRAFRTIEIKARVLNARGRVAEAVPLLQDAAKQYDDQAGSVAKLLEELGQPAAAEPFYRRFAAQGREPEATLVLAGFLARQSRISEALDLCERAWGTCPAEAVAVATVAVLFSAPIDPGQCERAAQSLERELAKVPQNAALVFHLGNVRCLQERYADAEKLYRQSFTLDQENTGPVSNLAWLLARRDGNGDAALKLVSQAIHRDGPVPDLLDARAIAYMTMGQIEPAIKDLENAIAVRPAALKYLHLAQAYLGAKRRSEASAALESAKTAGLSPESLSPLERAKCRQLLAELVPDSGSLETRDRGGARE
jgi:tetratricopeptide (TPR) repeat protein